MLTAPKPPEPPGRHSGRRAGRLACAYSTLNDAQLAQALQRGAPQAQLAAWRRFMPVVRGMARRRLGSRSADLDDAVQEAFIAIFASIERLREPHSLRAFALTVTARVLSRVQRRRRRASTGTDVDVEDIEGDEPPPPTRDAGLALAALVKRLRARERRAFELRFVEGMSAPEIARSLGVSVPTVRRLLSRAEGRIHAWAGRDAVLADLPLKRRRRQPPVFGKPHAC